MIRRLAHRIRRRVRLFSLAPLAWWTWKYRHDLRQAGPMLRSTPSRLRAGQGSDLLVEARVRRALATDESTRGDRRLEVRSLHEGVARLALTHGNRSAAVAVVSRVPGVHRVEVETLGEQGPPSAPAANLFSVSPAI